MKVIKGQIWKRTYFDQYLIITSKTGSRFYTECLAGSEGFGGKLCLDDYWFPEQCNLVNPVMCIKCETARARLTSGGQRYAKGLKCWSCTKKGSPPLVHEK